MYFLEYPAMVRRLLIMRGFFFFEGFFIYFLVGGDYTFLLFCIRIIKPLDLPPLFIPGFLRKQNPPR